MTDEAEIVEGIFDLLERRGDKHVVERGRRKAYNFVEAKTLDSFELLSFIGDLENVFGVEITTEDLGDDVNHTVGGLSLLIASKLAVSE